MCSKNDQAAFVLFEGMDLSGKSSTVSTIKRINPVYRYQHLELTEGNPLYTFAKQLNRQSKYSAEVAGTAYIAAIKADIEAFEHPVIPTLQDSSGLLRSLAHHTALGNTLVVNHLVALAERHPKFTHAFVFTASIEDRQKRLFKRIAETPGVVSKSDNLILDNPPLFELMDKTIVDFAQKLFGATVIDTSQHDQETVVHMITTALAA